MAWITNLVLISACLSVALTAPTADPQKAHAFFTSGNADCGPPRLLPYWRNITVGAGERVQVNCPLDQHNSCLVHLVEWYFSDTKPVPGSTNDRILLRDAAVRFDPLLAFFPNVSPEHTGWYTCVVGNNEGRREISTYLDVEPQQILPQAQVAVPQQQQQQRPQPPRLQMEVVRIDPRPQKQYHNYAPPMPVTASPNAIPASNVKSRFPVYSQFNPGSRVPPSSVRRPETTTTQAPIMSQPLRRREEENDVGVHLNAINQHIRYIYEKMDSMSGQVDEIERTVKRIDGRM